MPGSLLKKQQGPTIWPGPALSEISDWDQLAQVV